MKYFATKNANKVREVNEILGKELEQLDVELLEPQGIDVEEVVKLKAIDAFKQTRKVALVEDDGLEFDAWYGLPGAMVRWFSQSVGNRGILKMMKNEENRKARAKTALAFYDGKNCYVFTGEVQGTITDEMKGKGGFSWDSIFIPDGYEKSYAEMTPEEKNAISMRRVALMKLQAFLKEKRWF